MTQGGSGVFALSILPFGLVLGAIAWGAVGALRTRGREEFTLATAANFYAQVLMVAGLLALLSGLALLIKVGLSHIDPAYSYSMPQPPPPGAPERSGYFYSGPSIGQQQTQDLILASVLIVAGLLVAVGHWFLSRFVSTLPGASPAWVVRGTLVALTVLLGLVGIFSTIFAMFAALTYFIIGNRLGSMTFGDPAGTAIVFVPAWIIAMTVLLRQVRQRSGQTPAAQVPAPV
jgi:hypothetical protein